MTYLVNNPNEYKTEEEFLEALKTVCASQYQAITARNERITGRYLKKKGDPSKVPAHPGGGGKPLSKKPSMGGKGTEDNLQEVLEEALQEEAKKG